MNIDNSIISITFIVYIALMLVIGWIAYQRIHNLSDYILGGRGLGRWVAALSAGASDMSGWLLLGLPGYAYVSGLQAGWLAMGLLIGTYINWRLVAARLRLYSELANDSLTLPAFFEQRFNDQSHLLRVISAFFILLFFLFYTSSGLVAGGKLFETVFNIPYPWAVTCGTLAIILYTSFGGFLAVSWTDLVQGLLMAVALLLVPTVAIMHLGGWDLARKEIEKVNPELLNGMTDLNGEPLSLITIISLMAWGLGYFGQPHILARFKAIRSAEHVSGARRIAVSWTALTLASATLVGMVGIGFLDSPLTGADSEKIFMVMVSAIFHPVIAGVLLAAILAAIMSTADSQLLVSSSVLAEDFYKALLRREASQGELIMAGRLAVLVIALLAFSLALDPDSKVLDLVAYAWAGFGAAFGPVLLFSLYWKRITRNGALAGILTGGITVVVWKQLSGGLFNLYEIVPGFLLASLAVIMFSLVEKGPEEEIVRRHERLST